MGLAKEVATALGQKATAAYKWENCPSEEGCAYHQPTTFDMNESNGCTPTTEDPGYNRECNFHRSERSWPRKPEQLAGGQGSERVLEGRGTG